MNSTHLRGLDLLIAAITSTLFICSVSGQSSNPVQGTFTIQGYQGTPYNWPTITLDKDSSTPGATLSYNEPGDGTGVVIQRIDHAPGLWEWQAWDGSVDKLQMTLDANNILTLYDLTTPNVNAVIVMDPHGTTPGISVNGHRVVTVADLSAGNLSLATNGLTISNGNLQLPATISGGGAGVIYQGANPVFHTYDNSSIAAVPTNLFLGINAGSLTTANTGYMNTGLGWNALQNVNGGFRNEAVGSGALGNLTTGSFNVAIGATALGSLQGGFENVAIGDAALGTVTQTHSGNTGVGHAAMYISNGDQNTAIGDNAGSVITNGLLNGCTFIGYGAGCWWGQTGLNRCTAIGAGAYTTADNTMALGGTGDWNVVKVVINGSSAVGQLDVNVYSPWTPGLIVKGANSQTADLFQVRDSAGNVLDTMTASGAVGIGTTTPQTPLDVTGDATVRGVLRVPSAGDVGMGDFTNGTNPTP